MKMNKLNLTTMAGINVNLLNKKFGMDVVNSVKSNTQLLWGWDNFELEFIYFINQQVETHKNQNRKNISIFQNGYINLSPQQMKTVDEKVKPLVNMDNHYKTILDNIGQGIVDDRIQIIMFKRLKMWLEYLLLNWGH
jgi:hypothetical protein